MRSVSEKTQIKNRIAAALKAKVKRFETVKFGKKDQIPVKKGTQFSCDGGSGRESWKAIRDVKIAGIMLRWKTGEIMLSDEDSVVLTERGEPVWFLGTDGKKCFYNHGSLPLAAAPLDLMREIEKRVGDL